ncbi:hypothetical protein LA080_004534 [Diaporthe eres]|nr:hypothetical protein LA080_004534 [Diaporthe eres]
MAGPHSPPARPATHRGLDGGGRGSRLQRRQTGADRRHRLPQLHPVRLPDLPTLPYDAARDNHADPSREAVHPQHARDVLRGLALLKALGLTDGSYILTGHSAGACLSFQAIYQAPRYWRLASPSDDDENNVDPEEEPPTPAAHVAMNGLYDLPMTQTEKLEVRLREVDGLQVQRGHRCTGRHAAPWEEGIMIWENLLDVLKALE